MELKAALEGYATIQLPGALHVNSVQTYEAAGVAGLGLIQAALLGIGHHLESGALVEVLPDLRSAADVEDGRKLRGV